MVGFHHEKIDVTIGEGSPDPIGFRRGEKEYKVVGIKKVWQDAAFMGPASGRGRTKAWWDQHGKTFYRISAEDGQTFDIYYDPRKKAWYLSKSWGPIGQET